MKEPMTSNKTKRSSTPELLAPAGQEESFLAALENGADAVYLGLKSMSARASAVNFSLDELAALLPVARKRGVRVHVAFNSVMTASEIPQTLDTLQSLSDLGVDALIVADPGVFFLCRRFFPQLKLHASTLMTLHNHAGVQQLNRMGANRVVLARELTLEEIDEISRKTTADIEVFVHGALCFSYSGLCLASSFRGGRSGLRGQCVQPCRLKFRQGRKEGFFLSCNDLCALPLLPRLKKMRVASLKIEGRMKDADYLAVVVRAYRMVLDAQGKDEAAALDEAQRLLSRSPSRRLTLGFLDREAHNEVLSPHRSGSSGLWVGTVKKIEGQDALVALRHELRVGDRLRPESGEGKEKQAFTVSRLRNVRGDSLSEGASGKTVLLDMKIPLRPDERLFKIGARATSSSRPRGTEALKPSRLLSYRKSFAVREDVWEDWPRLGMDPRRAEETLILKVASEADAASAFQSPAHWVMLTASRQNLERYAKRRLHPAQRNRLMWSLPPLMTEKDVVYYRAAVQWMTDRGFNSWEVNDWGHLDLFHGVPAAVLIAGYRFNIRNGAAQACLADAGCRWGVFSLEITSQELSILGQGPFSLLPIVTVYGWPPLFTSRLMPGLLEGKPFFTPKKDAYFYKKTAHHSLIYADHPVSWFEQIPALRNMGYRCFLIDLSDGPLDQGREMSRLLSGYKRNRADAPFSLFNYERQPL